MENSSFSPTNPQLQFAWDSTSLGTLKECPRKYYYSIILGFQPRLESVHLTFGLHYHGALERYDHLKCQGKSHEEALRGAVRYAMEVTWDRQRQRPWLSDDPNKNRATLVRSVVWYLDQFADDPLKTVVLANGKPAVELSFRMEIGETAYTGEPYLLCGHLDRVATLNDQTFIVDRKTTKYTITPDFFAKYSPDNQFSTYCLAAKVVYKAPVAGLLVDAAQIMVTFSRFHRGIVLRDDSVLEEWLEDTLFWISQAENFARVGRWPMNDKSCSNYGGCPFRGVCAKSPAVRDQWLDADFHKRIWDPLQARGDI